MVTFAAMSDYQVETNTANLGVEERLMTHANFTLVIAREKNMRQLELSGIKQDVQDVLNINGATIRFIGATSNRRKICFVFSCQTAALNKIAPAVNQIAHKAIIEWY